MKKLKKSSESKIANRLIVIIGPTSAGKSALAVSLAKKFNGEVISADSRQVYKGMNLGTGKITPQEQQGVKHYLLDVVSPKKQFTVIDFVRLAEKAIKEIRKKGKIPIICGGTGFYIDALLYDLPKTVAPDWSLRKKLEKLSNEQLFKKLKKLDPKRAQTIDQHNKRRLIRALEIVLKTGQPVPPLKRKLKYVVLKIGIKRSKKELRKRIHERLLTRLKKGMVEEVAKLHYQGVSWQRLDSFGLEYRFISRYLRGLIKKEEMIKQLETAINQYARRQMTWFKRDKEIHWITNKKAAERLVKNFLKN